jgi:hypothetical protein
MSDEERKRFDEVEGLFKQLYPQAYQFHDQLERMVNQGGGAIDEEYVVYFCDLMPATMAHVLLAPVRWIEEESRLTLRNIYDKLREAGYPVLASYLAHHIVGLNQMRNNELQYSPSSDQRFFTPWGRDGAQRLARQLCCLTHDTAEYMIGDTPVSKDYTLYWHVFDYRKTTSLVRRCDSYLKSVQRRANAGTLTITQLGASTVSLLRWFSQWIENECGLHYSDRETVRGVLTEGRASTQQSQPEAQVNTNDPRVEFRRMAETLDAAAVGPYRLRVATFGELSVADWREGSTTMMSDMMQWVNAVPPGPRDGDVRVEAGTPQMFVDRAWTDLTNIIADDMGEDAA